MKLQRKAKMVVVGALTLIAVGAGLLWREQQVQKLHIPSIPVAVAQASSDTSDEPALSGRPVHLSIPALGKQWDVLEGSYSTGSRTWTLNSTHVFWANLSEKLNTTQGTTLLYAHAQEQLFGDLPKLSLGDEVIVRTDNGYDFRYRLVGGETVMPDQSAVAFKKNGAPRLLLQTCTGAWWQKRQLFAFDILEVKKV
ncbi:MAG: sortase [Candidatus Saccharimonadales bacterium]